MFRPGSRSAAVVSVIIAAAAVAVGAFAGGSGPAHGRGPLAAAMSSMPESTLVAGFTDWRHVMRQGSLTQARERDLVTRSALIDVAPGLAVALGVKLRNIEWEAYGQGGFGEAVVVRLKGAMPSADRLRGSGYRMDKGVWTATGRLAAVEPIYGSLVVLPRDGVLVLSAQRRAVAAIRDTLRGRTGSFADHRAVADAIVPLAGVHTALVQARGLGCQATEPGREPETARQVEAAEQRFGSVVRYSVLARGLRDAPSDTQRFRAAMTFPSAAVAADQAQIRGALSRGPFIGRSGDMAEVLQLRSSRADGRTVLLTYDHPADSEYLMTGQGPLLPASC